MVGAEAAVEFEVIGVVQEGPAERKQQLLDGNKSRQEEKEEKEKDE